MSEPMRATSAADWVKPKFDVVELPSGNVAELRSQFPIYLLLRTGQLPDELFAALVTLQEVGIEAVDPSMAGPLVDVITASMFVEPRVTADGADGTIAVADLSEDDIDFVMARVRGGGAPDESFRKQQAGSSGGGDSADVRDAAKPAARPAKRKPGSARSRSQAR